MVSRASPAVSVAPYHRRSETISGGFKTGVWFRTTPPGQGYFGGFTTVATRRRGTSEAGGFAARCIARIPLTRSAASAFT
jgi:hypothetical protein